MRPRDVVDLVALAVLWGASFLFMRIAGTSRSRDGYVTSYDYGCKNNSPAYGEPLGIPTQKKGGNCELATEGDQSVTAGRLSLRWIPTDAFEANFSMNIVNDKSGSQPSVLYSNRNMATNPSPIPIHKWI